MLRCMRLSIFNVSSLQEYTMATSVAVQNAPAARFAKARLKAITERIERLQEDDLRRS